MSHESLNAALSPPLRAQTHNTRVSSQGGSRRRDRGIRPYRNIVRFYGMSIEPTLFGYESLVRNWGRIGTPMPHCRDECLHTLHVLTLRHLIT
ncbi:MAG: WGR domain-containing protein, partial [Mesorhizobium sp.]